VLAALALGADGIYMGTRFMVTRESESHSRVKEAIIKGEDVCTASVPKEFMLARDLANRFTTGYMEIKKAGASPEELNNYLDVHSQYHAQHLGEADAAEICCGQVAGLITEVKGAGEVLNDLVENISACFEELQHRLVRFL
jgi:enoyl-[acyl-carrier protein] reductase II